MVYGVVITTTSTMLGLALPDIRREVRSFYDAPLRHIRSLELRRLAFNAVESLTTQSIGLLIPSPGMPLNDWLPEMRDNVFRQNVGVFIKILSQTDRQTVPLYSSRDREYWIILCGSLVLIGIAETLLRMRTVMIFIRGESSLIAPLVNSIHLGLKYFGRMTLHIWLFRLTLFTFCLLLIAVPTSLIQELILPNLTDLFPKLYLWLEIRPISAQVMTLSGVLVNVFYQIVTAIYDVKLFQRLTSPVLH